MPHPTDALLTGAKTVWSLFSLVPAILIVVLAAPIVVPVVIVLDRLGYLDRHE